jgi:hypothetical protein
VVGFDTVNQVPKLEGNTLAGAYNAIIATQTVIYKYIQPPAPANCGNIGGNPKNGYLLFQKGTLTGYATTPPLSQTICQELALPTDPDWPYPSTLYSGFEVSNVAGTVLPGLLTGTGGPHRFGLPGNSVPPVALRIKLVLKRASGLKTNLSRQFVWTTVETFVQLRPDQSY